jgi:hypothetical protein
LIPLAGEIYGNPVIPFTLSSANANNFGSASCNVWFNDLPLPNPNSSKPERAIERSNEAIYSTTQQLDELFNPDLLYLKNVHYGVPVPEGPGAVVQALWDCQDEHDNRLGLKEGNTIEVLTRLEVAGGMAFRTGGEGRFPSIIVVQRSSMASNKWTAYKISSRCIA